MLVVTKKQALELLKSFPGILEEMKTVAMRRHAYIQRAISDVREEYFGVVNVQGHDLFEFNDRDGQDHADDAVLAHQASKSQFLRLHSTMRQGEITLQKIRIERKIKNKKAIAFDVLKMLNDVKTAGREGDKKLSKMIPSSPDPNQKSPDQHSHDSREIVFGLDRVDEECDDDGGGEASLRRFESKLGELSNRAETKVLNTSTKLAMKHSLHTSGTDFNLLTLSKGAESHQTGGHRSSNRDQSQPSEKQSRREGYGPSTHSHEQPPQRKSQKASYFEL